ncbi:MAG: hypothetical protein ACE37H_08490 [Phycisphaeraceae bacterium]
MRNPRLLIALAALLLGWTTLPAPAQDEDGYNAAKYLLDQTTEPYRDGRHNTMLLSLRQLGDRDLLPLFNALSQSRFPAQRVHGVLGAAELSTDRRIDLAVLAEIENDRELVEVLSAAMDGEMIDKAGLATLLEWESLSPGVKQAIALRLLSKGGVIDPGKYRAPLGEVLSEETNTGALLQYALAALLLAEAGDAQGKAALEKLGKLQGASADAVLAQLFDGAMKHELKAAGPVALLVAKDSGRGASLRMLGVQTAMRLRAEGAGRHWQIMYANEQEPARRVRLALIAMDAAQAGETGPFEMLSASDDELLRHLGKAGRALANGEREPDRAFAPLLAMGQPLVNTWLVSYCGREKPAGYPALLEAVITAHHAGEARNRARLSEAAINAVQVLCEKAPDQATRRLAPLLANAVEPTGDHNAALAQRQIILVGAARAHGSDLKDFAKTIGTDKHNDMLTETFRLLLRARYGATLTNKEWTRVSDIVQGVGQVDLGLRVQLAWLYLEHMGKADQAIKDVLK